MPNRIAWRVLALAVLVPASRPAPAEPVRGDVVLKEDFDGAEALRAWDGVDAARVKVAAGRSGSSSLWVQKPAGEGPGGVAIRRALPLDKVRGVRVTRQGRMQFREEFHKRADPQQRTYYWLGGELPELDEGDDVDSTAVRQGYISITPLHYDLTDHAAIERLRAWSLE
jgi:hypothetical protein